MWYSLSELAQELEVSVRSVRVRLDQGPPCRRDECGNMWIDGRQFAAWVKARAILKKIKQTVKRFFTWLKLAHVREYRDLSLAWIEALRPPRSIELPAKHVFVTPGEVQQLIGFQGAAEDLALRRDQTAAALLLLSGIRASAFAMLPIAAVDLSGRTIKQ